MMGYVVTIKKQNPHPIIYVTMTFEVNEMCSKQQKSDQNITKNVYLLTEDTRKREERHQMQNFCF